MRRDSHTLTASIVSAKWEDWRRTGIATDTQRTYTESPPLVPKIAKEPFMAKIADANSQTGVREVLFIVEESNYLRTIDPVTGASS